MTEPLYLAFFIWATVYLSDFVFGLRDGKNARRKERWCDQASFYSWEC